MSSRVWGAILKGHIFDLQDWMEVLHPTHSPWAEEWTINDTPRLVLRSLGFDQLNDTSDVWEAAKMLVTRLNGAFATVKKSEPLSVEGIVERRPDGTIAQHAIFAVGGAHARARGGSLSGFVQVGPTAVQRWIELADQNDLIDDLLVHQSAEPSWYNLYKAFEVIRELCGGHRELERRDWCPSNLARFTHTANFYRHSGAHPARQSPPKDPMPLPDATNLIRGMANAFLQEH